MTEETISSPSSKLMQSRPISFEGETSTMEFIAPDSFKSPRGVVQGGLIGGFMDEVMGSAVMAASGGKLLPLNLDMNMSYLKPVPVGKLIGKGRVVKMGRKVVFIEGELYDEAGNLLVKSTSTAMLTEIPQGMYNG